MGYDDKKIVEANRGKNNVVLLIIAIAIFFLGVLILFTFFSPTTSLLEEGAQAGKRENLPRFFPPLLFGQPAQPDPYPFPWGKQDGITPVSWSGHYEDHGHHHSSHFFPHYYQRRPPIFVDPWYEYRFSPWGGLTDPNFSTRYWFQQEEKRPDLDMEFHPNGELKRFRSGFR